jgi:hypothetical protein
VVSSDAEHRMFHRKKGCSKRKPSEPNPMIACGCGCGNRLYKYDSSGRPRLHLYRHHAGRRSPEGRVLPTGVRRAGSTPPRFSSAIWRNGRGFFLGTFSTVQQAHFVYMEAAVRIMVERSTGKPAELADLRQGPRGGRGRSF